MAGAVAMGSGANLNRALKDLQKSFPHNFQDFFLKKVRESIGVLLGLPAVAGCFAAGCFGTEYFCTEYFVAGCFGTEDFCTEDFVAGCFVAGWFCAGYFCAERFDSDLWAESIAIFPELD